MDVNTPGFQLLSSQYMSTSYPILAIYKAYSHTFSNTIAKSSKPLNKIYDNVN
jgi:hypothetical protein